MSVELFRNKLFGQLHNIVAPHIAVSLAVTVVFYRWYNENVSMNGINSTNSTLDKSGILTAYKRDLLPTVNLFFDKLENVFSGDTRLSNAHALSLFNLRNDKKVVLATNVLIEEIFDYSGDLVLLFNAFYQTLRIDEFTSRYADTTDSVNDLIANLLLMDDYPSNRVAKAYDPTSGFGSSLLALHKLANQQISVYGQEINNETALFSIMNMIVNGVIEFEIREGDTIFHPRFITGNSVMKFDYVVAHPPYRVKNYYKHQLRSSDPYNRWPDEIGKDSYLDAAFISHIIASINDNGRAAVIVPNSFLTNQTRAEHAMRRQLVDSGLLKAVIHLPSHTGYHVAVNTSVLILGRYEFVPDGQVYFIDGKYNFIKLNKPLNGFSEEIIAKHCHNFRNLIEQNDYSVVVGKDRLVENEYLLHAGAYFVEAYINENINEDSVHLGDVLTQLKLERNQDENRRMKVITPQHLNNNIRLPTDHIEEKVPSKNAQILDQSALLLAVRNNDLVFTYVEVTQEPMALSSLVSAYAFDQSKVTLPYLAKQFTEEYFKYVTKNYFMGTAVVNRFTTATIFSFPIKLEALHLQNRLEDQYIEFFHQADKNLDLLEHSKQLIREENAYLRHSIAGPLSNINTFYPKLLELLNENRHTHIGDILDGKINTGSRFNFQQMSQIIQRDLEKINDYVSKHVDADTRIQEAILVPINLDSFLHNYIDEVKHRKPAFQIQYDSFLEYIREGIVKENYVTVMANEELLHILFDNLIDNAEKHAFGEGTADNRIEITLFYDDESDVFSINVSNTGRPLPQGFSHEDFVSKNRKAGQNAGSGYGGWYINQIVGKFGGELSIHNDGSIFTPEATRGFNTSVEIILPLIYTDNEE